MVSRGLAPWRRAASRLPLDRGCRRRTTGTARRPRSSAASKSRRYPWICGTRTARLWGLGSYIVNAQSAVPTATRLGLSRSSSPEEPLLRTAGDHQSDDLSRGGGRDFGPYPSSASPIHIVSRNLTPDHTGLPIGGDSFNEFRQTIRTGVDPDLLHPSLPPPFNGALLQIMPWPVYQDMTDRDLRAIYEYLSAVPCVPGPDTSADRAVQAGRPTPSRSGESDRAGAASRASSSYCRTDSRSRRPASRHGRRLRAKRAGRDLRGHVDERGAARRTRGLGGSVARSITHG